MSARARLTGPALAATVFVALAAWSWRKWPDALVDFGRELYAPWRLSAGDVLYRDVASLFGPLSPHVNALAFTAFGASFSTLIAVNLALLAILAGLVHALFAAVFDRVTAAVATLALLLLFGFGQYVGIGNYNWVAPYSHEATHGVLLAVVAVAGLARFARSGSRAASALVGLSLGLAALTRPDVALAAAAVVAAGLAALAATTRGGRIAWRASLVTLLAAALAPSLLFIAYFLTIGFTPAAALHAVSAAFTPLAHGIPGGAFYRRVMGLDDVTGNVASMLEASLAVGAFLGAAALADAGVSRLPRGRRAAQSLIVAATLAALTALYPHTSWLELPRCLPVVALAAIGVSAALLWNHRRAEDAAERLTACLAWTVLSLALLGKVALHARLSQYGFYLALPATLTLVGVLVGGVPAWLAARHGGGGLARALGIVGLAVAASAFLARAQHFYGRKGYPIGDGGDRIVTYRPDVDPAFPVVAAALAAIERDVARDETLLVLPEGVILNYLTRRRSPTSVNVFMPVELEVFGESAIVEALNAASPDWVVLVDRDTSEYGVRYFGTDYGRQLMEWVRAHYVHVALFGAPPLRWGLFGIELLRRADGAR